MNHKPKIEPEYIDSEGGPYAQLVDDGSVLQRKVKAKKKGAITRPRN